MVVKQSDRPVFDVAGAFGADPVVDRVVLGCGEQAAPATVGLLENRVVDRVVLSRGDQGASMTAQVTMSGGSG